MAATTSNATPRKNGFDFAALTASAGKQDSAEELARLRAALETLAELVIAHGVMDARTLSSIVGDLITPPMAPVSLAAPLPPPAPSAAEALLRGGVPKPAAVKPAAAKPIARAAAARPAAPPISRPAPAPMAPAPVTASAPVVAAPAIVAPAPAPFVTAPAPVVTAPAPVVAAPAPVVAAPAPFVAAPAPVVAAPAPVVAAPAPFVAAPAPVVAAPAPVVAAPAPVVAAPAPVAPARVPAPVTTKSFDAIVVPPSTVQPVVASPFPSEPAPAPQPARKNPFHTQDAARLEAELTEAPVPSLKGQGGFLSRLFGRPRTSPAAVAKSAASVEFTERVPKLPVDGLYSEQQRATELSFPPTSTVQRKPRAVAPAKKARPVNAAPARFCDRCWRRMDPSGTCKTCSPTLSA